ncbi:MAG: serine hydrolase [Pseudomonadales bacterium]|nr:serine hydrolase [Pseudomonadales bacterium]MDG1441986.1 serine hydrolase [Pseudomonadales bacterium]
MTARYTREVSCVSRQPGLNRGSCLSALTYPLFVCLLLISSGLPQAALGNEQFVQELERSLLVPLVDQAPGAAVVVVVDGEVVMQKTWGVKRQGDDTPITPFTLFRIASISKTFASAAAAILIEESKLSWQTPLNQSLNVDFKRKDYGDQINLSHLMSQTSGLMPHAYTNLVEDNMSYKRIVDRLNRVDFVCEPGKCYGYQNVVFSLVGDVVEANTGKDYATFVKDKLFEPLNMRRASFGRAAFLEDGNHAAPHVWTGNRWAPTLTTDHYYRIPPAAGVNASIDDMKVWLLAQLGHEPQVLSTEMLDTLHTGVIKTTRKQAHYAGRKGISNMHYGLGWRVFDYRGEPGFIQHGGYVRGMRSQMVFNRRLQTGFVFLTNSEPNHLGNLVFDYLDLYQKRIPVKEFPEAD